MGMFRRLINLLKDFDCFDEIKMFVINEKIINVLLYFLIYCL